MKKKLDVREKKMLNRVKDKIKLSGLAWRALLEDFNNEEIKSVICAKYRIPTKYYKWVKKIVKEGL